MVNPALSVLHSLLLTYLCVGSAFCTDVEGEKQRRHMLHAGPCSSLQPHDISLSRQSSEGSVESNYSEAGIVVLRNPKADQEEIISLKAKLSEATSREKELRRRITVLEQNIGCGELVDDLPKKTRQPSVTFAASDSDSDLSDEENDEEAPSSKKE